jgi:preprotein translocase subunit SecE
MAVDVARTTGTGEKPAGVGIVARTAEWVRSIPTGYRNVMTEMRKVTWPSRDDVQKMSVGVISLSLFIGGLIALMDVIFQQVLVRWIPSIFAGR